MIRRFHFALALLLAAGACTITGTPALAATLPATPATFAAVLAKAAGGDTIALASAQYGVLTVRNRTFAPALTITGPDAAVKGLYVSGAHGVTFTNMNIAAGPAPTSNSQAISILGGSRIVLEQSAISGGLAVIGLPFDAPKGTWHPSGNVIGLPSGKAINIYKCNDCRISGNAIGLFHKAITLSWGDRLVIADNTIDNLRTTPISGVPGANLTIAGNTTSDSHPWNFGGTGDHGDYLHLWTSGGAATGLRVTGNQFLQGGGQPMLGINLQAKDGRFIGAVLADNTVSGNLGQGLVISGCDGCRIERTTLIWTSPSPLLEKYGRPVNWRNQPRLDIVNTTINTTICGTVGGPVSLRPGTAPSVTVAKVCDGVTP